MILTKIRRPEFYDFVDDVVDDVYEFMIYKVDAESWIPLSFWMLKSRIRLMISRNWVIVKVIVIDQCS